MLGKKLKELRKEKGISQGQLAKAIGISRQAVGNWETDIREPSIRDIKLIAKYFEVTTDELLGCEEFGFDFKYESNGTKLSHKEKRGK
ncbi:MAG: helix-turn-helix transcriptional regulator [Firmicutes bacterium]|nr:helix-turn-helix transcriptional regulator [Bacillota bacterium]